MNLFYSDDDTSDLLEKCPLLPISNKKKFLQNIINIYNYIIINNKNNYCLISFNNNNIIKPFFSKDIISIEQYIEQNRLINFLIYIPKNKAKNYYQKNGFYKNYVIKNY